MMTIPGEAQTAFLITGGVVLVWLIGCVIWGATIEVTISDSESDKRYKAFMMSSALAWPFFLLVCSFHAPAWLGSRIAKAWRRRSEGSHHAEATIRFDFPDDAMTDQQLGKFAVQIFDCLNRAQIEDGFEGFTVTDVKIGKLADPHPRDNNFSG